MLSRVLCSFQNFGFGEASLFALRGLSNENLLFFSVHLKTTDPKGRNAAQSLPPKRKDNGDKDLGKNANSNQDADSFSIFSSRALVSEKEIEELVALREQVEDLQRKMFEKDELLKSLESSKSQVNAVHLKLDELKHLAAEKDSLIKSTQLQLSDAKVPRFPQLCF